MKEFDDSNDMPCGYEQFRSIEKKVRKVANMFLRDESIANAPRPMLDKLETAFMNEVEDVLEA